MKRKVCIILTCAMCLLPFSLAHAQEEGISPCGIPTPCKEGDHAGVPTGGEKLLGYGADSTGHWKEYGFEVKCRGCGIILEEVTTRTETKEPHFFIDRECVKCGYDNK